MNLVLLGGRESSVGVLTVLQAEGFAVEPRWG